MHRLSPGLARRRQARQPRPDDRHVHLGDQQAMWGGLRPRQPHFWSRRSRRRRLTRRRNSRRSALMIQIQQSLDLLRSIRRPVHGFVARVEPAVRPVLWLSHDHRRKLRGRQARVRHAADRKDLQGLLPTGRAEDEVGDRVNLPDGFRSGIAGVNLANPVIRGDRAARLARLGRLERRLSRSRSRARHCGGRALGARAARRREPLRSSHLPRVGELARPPAGARRNMRSRAGSTRSCSRR